MLDWEWASEQLASARNYWIVTSRTDGMPHAAPVWGLWLDSAVVFSTSRDSRKGLNLTQDPRAVVHLESGDDVVILEGEVEEIALDERLADEYEEKYAYRPGSEEGGFWLRLRPRVGYAWQESNYPRAATRFEFG
jgi:pyridoxine/pyridoxamine 5'-phosphate oxidase